jgi:hypothetical protein
MRLVRDRRQTLLMAIGLVVAVLVTVAFLWVWIGQWSITPGRYDTAGQWWREYALPRAAWSLVVGIPLASVASYSIYWLRERK